ncbi:U6 snRNA-associated Sm-like protein LSm8 [Saccopteryx leptura]|uniref:U6 snRNA-associated Sm-like protein LSm8 n=1 Tax=Saccopteryx leptura TaxID=249018 RepID=UPI00339D2188
MVNSEPIGDRIKTLVGASAVTSALENYINRIVAVITSDGRMIVGTLKGFDQTINLILNESHERVFSCSQGVEQVVLGLYIVGGDNVAVIGETDEETDSALDWGDIPAEPLNSVPY